MCGYIFDRFDAPGHGFFSLRFWGGVFCNIFRIIVMLEKSSPAELLVPGSNLFMFSGIQTFIHSASLI